MGSDRQENVDGFAEYIGNRLGNDHSINVRAFRRREHHRGTKGVDNMGWCLLVNSQGTKAGTENKDACRQRLIPTDGM